MTGEVGYWIMSKGQPSPANNYTQISAPGAVPLAWQIGGAL
jgi:hypothetical protein